MSKPLTTLKSNHNIEIDHDEDSLHQGSYSDGSYSDSSFHYHPDHEVIKSPIATNTSIKKTNIAEFHVPEHYINSKSSNKSLEVKNNPEVNFNDDNEYASDFSSFPSTRPTTTIDSHGIKSIPKFDNNHEESYGNDEFYSPVSSRPATTMIQHHETPIQKNSDINEVDENYYGDDFVLDSSRPNTSHVDDKITGINTEMESQKNVEDVYNDDFISIPSTRPVTSQVFNADVSSSAETEIAVKDGLILSADPEGNDDYYEETFDHIDESSHLDSNAKTIQDPVETDEFNYEDDNEKFQEVSNDISINKSSEIKSNLNNSLNIQINDKVEVNYKGKGKWYPGKVKRDHGDETFDILYDDGDAEIRVKLANIRLKGDISNVSNVSNVTTDSNVNNVEIPIPALPSSASAVKVSADVSIVNEKTLDERDREKVKELVTSDLKQSNLIKNSGANADQDDFNYEDSFDAPNNDDLSEITNDIPTTSAVPVPASVTAMSRHPLVNDKVEVNYKGKGKWYPGKVKRDHGDETFDILYDDGDAEIRVKLANIRLKGDISNVSNVSNVTTDSNNVNNVEIPIPALPSSLPSSGLSSDVLSSTSGVNIDKVDERDRGNTRPLDVSSNMNSQLSSQKELTESTNNQGIIDNINITSTVSIDGANINQKSAEVDNINYDDGFDTSNYNDDLSEITNDIPVALSSQTDAPSSNQVINSASNNHDMIQVTQVTDSKREAPQRQDMVSYLNSKVEINYKGKGKWYRGVISHDNMNETFDVIYDDGDKESYVPLSRIRILGAQDISTSTTITASVMATSRHPLVNDKVEVNYKGKGKWYPGKVKRDHGDETFDILYDDGDAEIRVKLANIRLKGDISNVSNVSNVTTDSNVNNVEIPIPALPSSDVLSSTSGVNIDKVDERDRENEKTACENEIAKHNNNSFDELSESSHYQMGSSSQVLDKVEESSFLTSVVIDSPRLSQEEDMNTDSTETTDAKTLIDKTINTVDANNLDLANRSETKELTSPLRARHTRSDSARVNVNSLLLWSTSQIHQYLDSHIDHFNIKINSTENDLPNMSSIEAFNEDLEAEEEDIVDASPITLQSAPSSIPQPILRRGVSTTNTRSSSSSMSKRSISLRNISKDREISARSKSDYSLSEYQHIRKQSSLHLPQVTQAKKQDVTNRKKVQGSSLYRRPGLADSIKSINGRKPIRLEDIPPTAYTSPDSLRKALLQSNEIEDIFTIPGLDIL